MEVATKEKLIFRAEIESLLHFDFYRTLCLRLYQNRLENFGEWSDLFKLRRPLTYSN